MGLDMTLTKRIRIDAKYDSSVTGNVSLQKAGLEVPIDFNEITDIVCEVGYWRKANQIHNWFVQNVQGGLDDCGEWYVSTEELLELKALCKKALETRDATLLPPTRGFFFGSTEVDSGYWGDIQDTIDMLNKISNSGKYYYRASW